MIFLIVLLVGAMVLFALYRRRHVKFGMKIFGATVFLEAVDPPGSSQGIVDCPQVRVESEQVSAAANQPNPKLIESTESK